MAPPHLNAAADLLDKVMSGPLSPEGAQTSSPAACVGAKVVKALVSFCQKTRFTTNIVMREVKAMEFQGDDFNYSALCASMPQRPVTERQMFALMKSEDEEMGVSANFSPVSDDVINPSSLPSGQEVDSSTSAQISGMFQNVWSLLEECGSGSNSNSSPVSRTVLVCTLFIIQVFKFLVTKVSNVNVLNQLFGHVVFGSLDVAPSNNNSVPSTVVNNNNKPSTSNNSNNISNKRVGGSNNSGGGRSKKVTATAKNPFNNVDGDNHGMFAGAPVDVNLDDFVFPQVETLTSKSTIPKEEVNVDEI
uniref:Wssv033 n=1 Tax=White spot syndrome virus TaxID=342409 RepID=A0A3G5BHF2_9VIRU|nr:wssv033 [White spot syndrome virus]